MKLFELQQIITPSETLFNFGSMRDVRVLETVLGREVPEEDMQSGYIRGYAVKKVKGRVYPALAKTGNMDSIVEGTLVKNLTKDDMKRIEFYEDGRYGIQILPIVTGSGEVRAQVYSYNIAHAPLAEDWDFEWYCKNNEDYRAYVKEVMEEYETK